MSKKDILRICGLVAAFVVCLTLGYFTAGMVKNVPQPDYDEDKLSETLTTMGGETSGADSQSAEGLQSEPGEKITTREDTVEINIQNKPDNESVVDNTANGEQPVVESVPEQVALSNTMPVITGSKKAAEKSSTQVNKLGYDYRATAMVESGDKLSYSLYGKNTSTAAYTSNNGIFKDVLPVAGGKYLLKVKNMRTGEEAEAEVSGFDMVSKWSAAQLEEQLNSMTQERMFYFHFDNSKLRLTCQGVDNPPLTINQLLGDRTAMGWKIKVVGTPGYDQYNRIVSLTVRIIVE